MLNSSRIASTLSDFTKGKGPGAGGSDGKFFRNTNKKGEIHELREELASPIKEKKRDAVKKVIANMTIGKDVSMLFPDVVNCIQTANVELKKLVYLYIINYAKSNPDLALLAVNTFHKDAKDPNPLIRALAVRTMGCIRVDRIMEYLIDPLAKALEDHDPYVRKTAAICVAKLYDISAEKVEDRGFLDTLRDLMGDSNPTVVANAVAALSEVQESSGRDVIQITGNLLQKLLAALNECTEWGQVFILDCLATYEPHDTQEAEGIIERVVPRLQHANSAVVMSAIKVILGYLEMCNADVIRTYSKKLAPPLVTLLNSEPEIQYVALRNINIIVQKRPQILDNEIKVFFCKYNDPIYVKMEKLEIIIRLSNDRNIDSVLSELKEYAQEVDVEFVRRSVRAIGRIAIKLEHAAQKCIDRLLELIQTKVNYVVQEAIVVIKDIFRRYPNRYESIIGILCENLETLDEPEAKASMIWIIGEYADRIENADELIESFFLETFEEETSMVQLQLLSATVKLFIKQPNETQELVQKVLTLATEHSDNPDLRDRGFIYWRLLSRDPQVAKAVILSDKPTIADDTFSLEPELLELLVSQISTLSSIYHKPPEAFVTRQKTVSSGDDESDDDDMEEYVDEDDDYEEGEEEKQGGGSKTTTGKDEKGNDNNVDLLDMLDMDDGPTTSSAPSNTNTNPTSGSNSLDLFSTPDLSVSSMAITPVVEKKVICTSEQGQGIEIKGILTLNQSNNSPQLEMDFTNTSSGSVSTLAIKFNTNTFGITAGAPTINFSTPLAPMGGKGSFTLPLQLSPQSVNTSQPPSTNLQTAIKNMSTNSVFYCTTPVNLDAILRLDGQVQKAAFGQAWQTTAATGVQNNVNGLSISSFTDLKTKLDQARIKVVLEQPSNSTPNATEGYFACVTMSNVHCLFHVLMQNNGTNVAIITTRCQVGALSASFADMISSILK